VAVTQLISVEHHDAVAVVTLQRSDKKNALSIALRDEVSSAIDALVDQVAVKVIVITGAGDTFSAGFDLAEFGTDDPDHQDRLWASSDRFHHAVLRCALPTIAAVNGPALAGGFDLAVLCDLRVAAATARFAHVEHAWSDVVYRPLRDLIGGGHARELVLTGRSIDAAEALSLGLVNRLAEPERLLDVTFELAHQIAEAPRDALVRTKAKIVATAAIDPSTRTLDL
jgi:enoyl-CoA hydratase